MDNFFAAVESRRHAWPQGRADWHFHLLPTPEQARQLASPFRELVNQPGLHPVAPEWLHITVAHFGPDDDCTSQELDAIIGRVRTAIADVPPVTLTFARPAVGNVAIERAARPAAGARRLWEITWKAADAVVEGRWPRIPTRYYPHTSLAYAGKRAAEADRGRLKEILSDIDGPDAGEVTLEFDRLSLVAQSHDRRYITWERRLDIPLGAGR